MSTPKELWSVFKPGTPLHDAMLGEIMTRASLSAERISERFPSWNETEQNLRMFVPMDDVDEQGNLKNPFGTMQIQVPKSIAVRDALATTLWLPYVYREPITPIRGRGPEDVLSGELMAVVIDYQIRKKKALLTLYAAILDALDFGLGVMKTRWVKETSYRWSKLNGGRVRERATDYEGCVTDLVDIFRFLPDPAFPVAHYSRGDTCGFHFSLSHPDFLSRAFDAEWIQPTVDDVDERRKDFDPKFAWLSDQRDQSQRNRATGTSDPDDATPAANHSMQTKGRARPHTMLEWWWKVIPSDWRKEAKRSKASAEAMKYFRGDKPEVWCITVLDGETIVDVDPTDQSQFPFRVLESNPDLKSQFNRGVIEMLNGPQYLLNWFWNSHVHQVNSALANQFIYDPTMFYEEDILDPNPGKRIRLRPEAYGRDVRTMFYQIPWVDATQGNVRDLAQLSEMMDTLSGVSQNYQSVASRGRRSATEMSTVNTQTMQRSQKLGALMELEGIESWFEHMVELTMGNMESPQWFAITGQLASLFGQDGQIKPPPLKEVMGRNFAKIGPMDVIGSYDFDTISHSQPLHSPMFAQVWQQTLDTVGRYPALQQRVDPWWVFKQQMASMGIRNIADAQIRSSMIGPGQAAANGGDPALLGLTPNTGAAVAPSLAGEA